MSGARLRPGLVCAAICFAGPVCADPVEDFYRGKTVEFYIGTGEGPGAVTAYPNALAEFMGKYIPGNPSIIVRYLPGGAGIKAGNFIYGVAPQNGTVVGFINRGFVLSPLLTNQTQYDPTKFNWLGSPAHETSVGAVWTAGTSVRTIQDAMTTPVIVGGTAPSNDTGLFPIVLNKFLGAKFSVVLGYRSTPDVEFAMERGEVQGKIGWTWGSLNSGRTIDYVPSGKVRVIIQLGLRKSPLIPDDVPAAIDLARNEDDRQVMSFMFGSGELGNPVFMGPGVPADRVAAMRAAYFKTLSDPRFIELAKRQNLPLDPVSGEELKRTVDAIYGLPSRAIDGARALIPPT